MQPHEQRVVDEKKELDEKREKLIQFIGHSDIYKKLDSEDQRLLRQQHEFMSHYSSILATRIERFPAQ